MRGRLRNPLVALAVVVAFTLPWLLVWVTGRVEQLSPSMQVGVSGLAVLSASFLLAWGAETAEKDVPRSFAIAVLALVAVAPEYAVDAYYAWQAGQTPGGGEAANLAIANMTGANRILIGIGWSGIALYSIYQIRRYAGDGSVETTGHLLGDYVWLDPKIALEIVFLLLATIVAFFIPFSGGIGAVDTIVLVGIYMLYITIVIRGDIEVYEAQIGVPAYLQQFGRWVRLPLVLLLFAFSGVLIFTSVPPFAHGLEDLGLQFGIPKFFMIQWIAPLASESPELVVTAYLVSKARSTAAFTALISSKLNQWTLLIGTLAVVYSISLGQYGVLPFDSKQAAEIWLTAGQSLFAILLLINFRFSLGEALTLLVLFVSQVFVEFVIIRLFTEPLTTRYSIWLLLGYTAVYLVASAVLIVVRRDQFRLVFARARLIIGGSSLESEPPPR